MKHLYYSDKARQTAINEIWKQIDILMNIPCEVLGGYGVASGICQNLAKLQDIIYAEVEDKNAVKRYKD